MAEVDLSPKSQPIKVFVRIYPENERCPNNAATKAMNMLSLRRKSSAPVISHTASEFDGRSSSKLILHNSSLDARDLATSTESQRLNRVNVIGAGDQLLKILKPKGPTREVDKAFHFDRVFSERHSQEDVYSAVKSDIIDVVNGYNCTILTHGASRSGKTFTMAGEEYNEGIIPRGLRDLFATIDSNTQNNPDVHYHTEMSYVELYNNIFRDLLRLPEQKKPQSSEKSFRKRVAMDSSFDEEGVRVPASTMSSSSSYGDLLLGAVQSNHNINTVAANPTKRIKVSATTERKIFSSNRIDLFDCELLGSVLTGPSNIHTPVYSENEALKLFERGQKFRTTALTAGGHISSRSHAVLMLTCECRTFNDHSAIEVTKELHGNLHRWAFENSDNNNNGNCVADADVLHATPQSRAPLTGSALDNGFNSGSRSDTSTPTGLTATSSELLSKTYLASNLRIGKLYFVDLASSDRMDASAAVGDALLESQYINTSLTALGDVLNALHKSTVAATSKQKRLRQQQQGSSVVTAPSSTPDSLAADVNPQQPSSSAATKVQRLIKQFQQQHVPYLNSSLTHLLKHALGGNSKTTMIATVHCTEPYLSVTKNTLHYAGWAKTILNPVSCVEVFHVGRSTQWSSEEDPAVVRLKQELEIRSQDIGQQRLRQVHGDQLPEWFIRHIVRLQADANAGAVAAAAAARTSGFTTSSDALEGGNINDCTSSPPPSKELYAALQAELSQLHSKANSITALYRDSETARSALEKHTQGLAQQLETQLAQGQEHAEQLQQRILNTEEQMRELQHINNQKISALEEQLLTNQRYDASSSTHFQDPCFSADNDGIRLELEAKLQQSEALRSQLLGEAQRLIDDKDGLLQEQQLIIDDREATIAALKRQLSDIQHSAGYAPTASTASTTAPTTTAPNAGKGGCSTPASMFMDVTIPTATLEKGGTDDGSASASVVGAAAAASSVTAINLSHKPTASTAGASTATSASTATGTATSTNSASALTTPTNPIANSTQKIFSKLTSSVSSKLSQARNSFTSSNKVAIVASTVVAAAALAATKMAHHKKN